jgi:hypothetical protein
MIHYSSHLLICFYSFIFIACWNHPANNAAIGKSTIADTSKIANHTSTIPIDSHIVDKDKLTRIYVQSIGDYINAVHQEYKLTFDTLFFGKHVFGQADDFPDIELPATIKNIPVRLISPEIGLQKQKERKSLFYINLMGWANDEAAEFIFVTFSNGCQHQFDCFMNYDYQDDSKSFQLVNTRFDNYAYQKK